MKIIAYGEDGLTFWALTTRLEDILKQLGDDTEPSQCITIYRPSFGRSGGNSSPQFGEFDAILITSKAVYLIESKWDNVADGPRDRVVLEEVQITRHRIFAWLRREWQEIRPASWEQFRNAVGGTFTQTFPNRPLATFKRLLARNLAYLLSLLEKHPANMVNVLLYFHRATVTPATEIVDTQRCDLSAPDAVAQFRKPVCLIYQGFDTSGLFELQP
jgi:hypothetical protein